MAAPTATKADIDFGIAELLESILIQLDNRTLLLSQRTSRSFRDTIEGYQKLQQKLFLQPMPVNEHYHCFEKDCFKPDCKNGTSTQHTNPLLAWVPVRVMPGFEITLRSRYGTNHTVLVLETKLPSMSRTACGAWIVSADSLAERNTASWLKEAGKGC
jgi:hypothetical protein